MRTRTLILTGLGIITLTGFAFLARAETNIHSDKPLFPRLAERLAMLGVTDQQKTDAKAILRQHLPEVEPLVKQLVTERRSLRDSIRAETVDETAIRAQSAKVAAVEADLAVQRAHIAHDLRAVLTPAQIDKLHDMQVDVDAKIDTALGRIAKRISEE